MITQLFKACFLMVFFFAPLAGQSWGSFSRPLSQETLRDFGFHLTRDTISLVVFDSADEKWRDIFQRLATEEKICELPIVFRMAGKGVANELYAREKWPSGQRWALIDWDSEVHVSGNSIPTAKEIADSLDSTNIKTSIQRLRDFVFQNPDNVDARRVLVSKLAQIASRRTAIVLGINNKVSQDYDAEMLSFGDDKGLSFSNFPTEEDYQHAPDGTELNAQQDYSIWGEYSSELSKLLQTDQWVAISHNGFYKAPGRFSFLSPLANYSPMVKSAYKRLLPRVEDFLRKFPSHGVAWQVWIAMTNAVGNDLIRESDRLMEDLHPLPWTAFDWPPHLLQEALFKRAITDENWDYIIKYGGERWNLLLEMMFGGGEPKKEKPQLAMPVLNEHIWKTVIEPLLEAYLAKGNLHMAEDILDYWKVCEGWAGAFNLASALAEKYNYPAYAKTWRR
ncbi:MAG: hypothetical protein FWG02_01455 [Holophagaceae bacterium]|nr:hypothetical protein [Holophagaceae bacterium]